MTSENATGPLQTPLQRVLPEWIDPNGHMNMAYYNVVFDRAVDSALDQFGLGPDYVASGQGSIFVAEAHIVYQAEVLLDDPLAIDFQLLDWDAKRLHFIVTMRHVERRTVAATSEQLCLHIGMPGRRVTAFSIEQQKSIKALAERHARLARPDQVGRVIGIRKPGR